MAAAAATKPVLATADHVALALKRGGEDPNCAFLLAAVHTVQAQCAHLQRLLGQPVDEPTLAAAPKPGGDPIMALLDPAFPRERIATVAFDNLFMSPWRPFSSLDWGEATDAFANRWLGVWNLGERDRLLLAMRRRAAEATEFKCDPETGVLDHEVVDCIYFLTHWVLLRTEYGTRTWPFEENDDDGRLHQVFERLFHSLDGLLVPHHEAQAEVALCHLLTSWTAHDRPKDMTSYLRLLLALDASDSAHMPDVDAAHLHCLIALWDVVDDKHTLLHEWCARVPAYGPWPAEPSLQRDGFAFLRFDPALLSREQKTRGTHGVVRIEAKDHSRRIEGDLEVPNAKPFVQLRERILSLLPGARLDPSETYVRRKAPLAHTGLHADYFHYRDEHLLFEGHPETEGDVCSTCNVNDSDDLLMCDRCGGCVHPLCVFPRVASLPRGLWLCPPCERQPLDYFTVWVPLHDLADKQHSVLTVVPGSHLSRDWTSRITEDLHCPGDFDQSRLCSGSLPAGTAIVFNVKTVHGATRGRETRLSLDFRVRMRAQ